MKQILFLASLLLYSITGYSQAGSLPKPPPSPPMQTNPNPSPVHIVKMASSVSIYFSQTYGQVTITFTNYAGNTVYSNTFNAQSGSSFSTGISSLEPVYKIRVTGKFGILIAEL